MKTLFPFALCACLISFSAQAAGDCTEIRFAPGATSSEIQGEAPAEGVLCYLMRTGAGQNARIEVLEGSNTIVTVEDVADARANLSFTTEARQYRVYVGQLMRAIEPQPFRVLVSVN
jgi:hypothetical protein